MRGKNFLVHKGVNDQSYTYQFNENQMDNFSVEKYASELFTVKFGSRLDTRFKKLLEEFAELKQAYEDYMNGTGTLDHVVDETSDVEAVLLHIRSIISNKTHEESILDAVLKVKIREHNKNYKKEV